MKKVLIVVLLALISFGVGLALTFMRMPTLAPDLVQEMRIADSLARAEAMGLLRMPPSEEIAPWAQLMLETMHEDSLIQLQHAAMYMMGLSSDSLRTLQNLAERALFMADSLREAGEAYAALAAVEPPPAEDDAASVQADVIGRTLSRLEEEEIRGIVSQVDMPVFRLIYETASERNRSRLLQALPPDRAARFVSDYVMPGSGQPARPAEDPPTEAN